ncbi:MAG TPA: class I SAM-dependent methyltransferase [Anaerolineales bacterium]
MFPLLYHAHHSHYQEDLPFWLALAAHAGDPLLELGCGTGRVLMPLAQAGYHTTGLDNDLSMLKLLRTNIAVTGEVVPSLIASDMRRFGLAVKFHLVILPCNTFSTLNENERIRCLSCIRMCLLPGGVFALGMPNPRSLSRLPARSEAELEDEFLHPQTGNPVQVSSSWQRTKHTFIVTWYYDHLLPDGLVERLVSKTVHQIAPLDTYIFEINHAGFSVTQIYGDFEHSKYTEDSPHCIITSVRTKY